MSVGRFVPVFLCLLFASVAFAADKPAPAEELPALRIMIKDLSEHGLRWYFERPCPAEALSECLVLRKAGGPSLLELSPRDTAGYCYNEHQRGLVIFTDFREHGAPGPLFLIILFRDGRMEPQVPVRLSELRDVVAAGAVRFEPGPEKTTEVRQTCLPRVLSADGTEVGALDFSGAAPVLKLAAPLRPE